MSSGEAGQFPSAKEPNTLEELARFDTEALFRWMASVVGEARAQIIRHEEWTGDGFVALCCSDGVVDEEKAVKLLSKNLGWPAGVAAKVVGKLEALGS